MKTSRNGAPPPAEDLASEIDRLNREVGVVESSGPPLEVLLARAEAELREAEELFRRPGFTPYGGSAGETAHLQRAALKGALIVTNAEAIVASERERITKQFERSGSLGLPESEKAERLAALRRQLRILSARREQAWRSEETNGLTVARGAGFDPECYLSTDDGLAVIAAGAEEKAA